MTEQIDPRTIAEQIAAAAWGEQWLAASAEVCARHLDALTEKIDAAIETMHVGRPPQAFPPRYMYILDEGDRLQVIDTQGHTTIINDHVEDTLGRLLGLFEDAQARVAELELDAELEAA
ncbi:MAG: hypothetical protein M1546_24610 [Chloroflexi bacterium]|nr:hypothetical protein [Chloroflexota bacterium]